MNLKRKLIFLGLVTTVAACAPKAPPPPPPPPPPPVAVIPPRPLPPGNASLTQILPARTADGSFATANANLSGERAFWHMKIGLNVAAIGCRGPEEATLVAAYNQIVKTHVRTIQSTEKAVVTQINKELKTKGNGARDKLSTSLFNYFAQPPAQRAFCVKANEIAQIVAATPSQNLVTESTAHLVALDQPFIDFYNAYAQYQRDVAAWDAQYGSQFAPTEPAAQPQAQVVAATSATVN